MYSICAVLLKPEGDPRDLQRPPGCRRPTRRELATLLLCHVTGVAAGHPSLTRQEPVLISAWARRDRPVAGFSSRVFTLFPALDGACDAAIGRPRRGSPAGSPMRSATGTWSYAVHRRDCSQSVRVGERPPHQVLPADRGSHERAGGGAGKALRRRSQGAHRDVPQATRRRHAICRSCWFPPSPRCARQPSARWASAISTCS